MSKNKRRQLSNNRSLSGHLEPAADGAPQFSPNLTYAMCKKIDGIESPGTSSIWAMRVSKGYGSFLESVGPHRPSSDYEVMDFPITKKMLEDAYAYRIPAYQRLFSLNDIKKVLLIDKSAVSLGFDIFEGIYNAHSGYVPLPKANEIKLAAHSVCIFGYDEEKHVLTFANSWGEGWGNNGIGYIPYAYLENHTIECWSIMNWPYWIECRQKVDESNFMARNQEKIKAQLYKIQSIVYGRSPLWVLDLFGADHKICGWSHFSVSDNGHIMVIEDIFILPPSRHLGLGSKLLEIIENVATSYVASEVTGWVVVQDIVPEEKEITVKSYFAKAGFELELDTERFRGSYWRVKKRITSNIFFGAKGEPDIAKSDRPAVPPIKPDALLADVIQKAQHPSAFNRQGCSPDNSPS